MNKTLKKSSLMVMSILLLLAALAVAHAFYITNNLHPLSEDCHPQMELGKGEFFENECFYSYSHLSVSVPDVELINSKGGYVKMEGYENAWWVQNMEVRGDTLYISKIDECMPEYVTDETINAVKYFVGAANLKSITVNNNGSVIHPLKPYAAHADGEPVYRPADREYHTIQFDELDLHFYGDAYVNLLLEGNKLNVFFDDSSVHKTTNRNLSQARFTNLNGTLDELIVNQGSGRFNLFADYLTLKKATINPKKNKNNDVSGYINLNCSDQLTAYLYSDLNVKYTGHPEITKEETLYGRVINGNK